MKAMAMADAGLPTLGLGGVATCLDKKGGHVVPNFSWPVIVGVEFVLVFDAGRANNGNVAWAEARLARALMTAGAKCVRVASIPLGPDGSDLGPDDYLARHGDAALAQVLASAQPADPRARVRVLDALARPQQVEQARRLLNDLPFLFSVHEAEPAAALEIKDALQRMDVPSQSINQALRRAKRDREDALKARLATDPCDADLADAFLDETGLRKGHELRLREYAGAFWIHEGNRYREVPGDELGSWVVGYLQARKDARKRVTPNRVASVIGNLRGSCFVAADPSPPCWLGTPRTPATHLISMANAIFDLDALMHGGHVVPHMHTSAFFTMAALTYPFDPGAQCPTWTRLLQEIQPDPEVRRHLAEWVGYNLCHDTSLQKFMILLGDGANGKSAFCCGMRAIVGAQNTSALSLEAFDPKRTFPLASTIGKTANISQDMAEIDRAGEGILKAFVEGSPIQVERKFGHPFQLKPTARLTFATNNLPRFRDRTDGLWRRVMIVPFPVRFLDESKQDKRLADPHFWETSVELPGMFLWALAGLKRLRERGHFLEPSVCAEAKQTYRCESNPAQMYLLEHCECIGGATISTHELYVRYSDEIRAGGHVPLSIMLFGREVKRTFPGVEATKNAIRHPHLIDVRCRYWIGLRMKS